MPFTARPGEGGAPRSAGCMEACVIFLLKEEGFDLEVDDLPDLWDPRIEPHEWKWLLSEWIEQTTGRPLRFWQARPRRRTCIAVGWSPRSPRARRHAVVLAADGSMLYDPHSSEAGVINPDGFYWW